MNNESGRIAPDYHIIPIDQVQVGDRARSEVGDLRELVDSIREHDLLHPIVLTRDNVLLAGYRRLSACKRLEWTHIYVRYLDECDSVTAREIELEENLARLDLSWPDEDRLRAEIDRLKRAKYGSHVAGMDGRGHHVEGPDGGWDSSDTAEALGVSQPTITTSIARVEAMELVPSIGDAPTRRAADREIDRFCQEIETELNIRQRNRARLPDMSESVMFGDCTTLMGTMSQECVDLIVTDPPYGIDVSGGTEGSGHRNPAEYDDDPVAVMATLRTAFREMRRLLRHSGHAYIFVGSKPVDQVVIIDLLAQSGFDVDPIPLIWHKNSHTTVDWDYRYAPCYESILFCSNRQRRLTGKRENIFRIDNDPDRIHTAQKPIALLRLLIEQSSAVGEVVFDPFMGSGSTLVAAIESGRRYIGMECGKATFDAARLRIARAVEAQTALGSGSRGGDKQEAIGAEGSEQEVPEGVIQSTTS